MSIRPIIYFGDERLTNPSTKVSDFGPPLQHLIDDMFETMYALNGIGLAAPQVGINQQLTVIDITQDTSAQWCLINPEIIFREGECWMEEGCLSIPGAFDQIPRSATIRVKALDRYGKHFELTCDGLLARCIQHEHDHLQGKLFIDHLSSFKRQRATERYIKALRRIKKGS